MDLGAILAVVVILLLPGMGLMYLLGMIIGFLARAFGKTEYELEDNHD